MQIHNHGVDAVGDNDSGQDERDSENEDGENIAVELATSLPHLVVNSVYVMLY